MGRKYWVDLPPTAITVAADLFEFTCGDDKPIRILDQEVFQTTDTGDAAEEIIGLLWVRGHATSGSGGSTATPRPCNPTDTAATFTVENANTTPASAGTGVNLARTGWNVRVPAIKTQIPEGCPEATQASLLVLRMQAAPADSLTISATVLVEELG